MKKNALTLLFFVSMTLGQAANAGLILDISNVGGYAELTMTGSDTVASGSSSVNGFWVHGSEVTAMFNIDPPTGSYAITSGSGEITNTQHGSSGIGDTYLGIDDSCCNFGIRNGSGGILATGDAISWSGQILTTIEFSWLNQGTYTFDRVVAYSTGGAILTDGITINVGSVPEPASYLLLLIGLLGFTTTRRRLFE